MSKYDGKCNECGGEGGAVRHSFTVYAGFLCVPCAFHGYRDHCGLEGAQGDPSELDEPTGVEA